MDGSHFATLVCGKASKDGEIEICNAGHSPPLVVSKRGVSSLDSTGFPVGLVESSPYDVLKLTLMVEETLFLYSDGLTEARDPADQLYGVDRLTRVLSENRAVSPAALAAACLKDLAAFQNGVPKADDLTIMVVRRTG